MDEDAWQELERGQKEKDERERKISMWEFGNVPRCTCCFLESHTNIVFLLHVIPYLCISIIRRQMSKRQ